MRFVKTWLKFQLTHAHCRVYEKLQNQMVFWNTYFTPRVSTPSTVHDIALELTALGQRGCAFRIYELELRRARLAEELAEL